jgi:hypothetical protein
MRRLPVAALAALLLAPPVLGQPRRAAGDPPQPVPIPGRGTELFRALLDRAGVKPITRAELWQTNLGENDIVIVLGTLDTPGHRLQTPASYANIAVLNGGAALIASDRPGPPMAWVTGPRGDPLAWVDVGPGQVHCRDRDSVHSIRDDEGNLTPLNSCPYVVPAPQNIAPDPDTPTGKLFDGLPRVATNHPGYLHSAGLARHFRQVLATYPKDCYVTDEFGVRWAELAEGTAFAVGGYGAEQFGDRYRFLALADHSVFINQMLCSPGAQNMEFTYRVIDFLTDPTFEGPEGKRVNRRSRCLFIEDGEVKEHFDELRRAFAPPKPPLPIPDLAALEEKLVDLGNAILGDVQERNVINNILSRGYGVPAIVRVLLLLLTVYAAWFLMKRLFTARKPTDLPPPPNVAGVPAGPPGVFDRRQKELLRRNNVYEPVRDLVREFFASMGVKGEPGPRLPGVVISAAVRRPESLRAALKDFWKLAFGPPQEVTVRRWQEMEPYFDRLRQAHADGKWRFTDEMA